MIHGLDTGFLVAAEVREHAAHADAPCPAGAGALGRRRHRHRPAGTGGIYPCRHRPPSFHAAARHDRGTSCCRTVVDVKRRCTNVPRRRCRAAVSHVAAAVLVGPEATAGYAPCRNLPAGRNPIAPHDQSVGLPGFRCLYVHLAHSRWHESLNAQSEDLQCQPIGITVSVRA